MPHSTRWEMPGIRWVFTGELHGDELIELNEGLYQDPRFEDLRYQIVDLLSIGIDEFLVGADAVRELARMDRKAAERNPDMKVAIVATEPVMKGLSRMYELEGAGEAWEIGVFDTLEEARTWVGAE